MTTERKKDPKATGWANSIVFQSQCKDPKNSQRSLLFQHLQARFPQVLGDDQETRQCLSPSPSHPPALPAAQTADTLEAKPTVPPPPCYGEPRLGVQAAPPNPGLHQRLSKAPPCSSPQAQAAGGAGVSRAPSFSLRGAGKPGPVPPTPKICPSIPEEREGEKAKELINKNKHRPFNIWKYF